MHRSNTESFTPPAFSYQAVNTGVVQILAANLARKKFVIQNVGTTRIKLGFGSNPSQAAYHVCLPAGGMNDDGSSPPYIDETWIGAVYAISSLDGGNVTVTEFV